MPRAQLLCCAVFCFLVPSSTEPSAVNVTSQLCEWTCVCEPDGLIGTQVYTGIEKEGFTECSCPRDCPICPAGRVLDPLHMRDDSCVCLKSLFVVIHLHHLRLSNYTPDIEKHFATDLASYLHLSPSQVIPGSRRYASVILDFYIVSSSDDPTYFRTLGKWLLQQNGTKSSLLGPWEVVQIKDFSYSGGVATEKALADGKLFVAVLSLCAAIVILLLLISVVFFLYNKKRNVKDMPKSLSKENIHSCSFRSLLTQPSSLSGRFLVYDNTCFNGSAGGGRKRSFRTSSKVEPLPSSMMRQFSFTELHDATRGFSKKTLIGIGGSSFVYQGRLRDGKEVAVKKLTSDSGHGFSQELVLEVELLSRLHHFHLIPLIGYCFETQRLDLERLLVYEYMPNGNLRELLNQDTGKEALTWTARLRIALGAARGLEYLHEAADPPVIHRDFKSSNILLDKKWRAKVADFGMAKIVKDMDSSSCPTSPAQMLGTFGYFAPEYAMTGRASTKSDVFSFGVVLLEIISGCKPVDKNHPLGQESLVAWALPMLCNPLRLVEDFLDPALEHDVRIQDLQKVAYLAWLCLQIDPDSRPSMSTVVQVLANLIPQTRGTGPELEHMMAHRDGVFPCTQSYSFCRDTESYPKVSVDGVDQYKPSKHIFLLGSDGELVCKKVPAKIPAALTLSLPEYLEKQGTVAASDNISASLDGMTNLGSEFLWQKNGLVVRT